MVLGFLGRNVRAVCLALATCFAGTSALAQTAADRETARTLMVSGDSAFEKQDYGAALEAYQAAHGIMNVPSTGIALARAQERLGKLVEARDTALQVTRLPVGASEPEAFTRARADASALADQLAPRIPSLTVNVQNAPADGLEVTIDGRPLDQRLLGLPRKLNPGKHAVAASAPGYGQAATEVELAEGATESVALELSPEAQPAASAVPAPIPAAESPMADTETSTGLSPLVYIGFGIGGAGIAVGAVTGVLSLSKTSSAKEHCDGDRCTPAAQDDIDSATTFANIANVGFAVGLVGIGVGIYGLLSSSETRGSEQVSGVALEPVVGDRYVGVAGAF